MHKGMITAATTSDLPKTQFEPTLLLDGTFISAAADLVSKARKSVDICAYTWRWYENTPEKNIQQFNYNVARLIKKGVRVRALMHKKTEALYLRSYGINTKILPTERVMHTKAILIDDEVLILGSHNLTERGTSENYEASVLVRECQAVTLFQEYYDRMWRNFAES